MSWLSSIVIALLTGVLGLFSAGVIMSACVNWYRVSSFEGKSGYAIIAVALLGGVMGLIIGLVTARLVAAGAAPGFLKGLGCSWGIVLGLAGLATLLSWTLADIPPKIDGQELDLLVEIRLPVGVTNSPVAGTGESHLTLASSVRHTQRKSQRGVLKVAEARFEGGRWIVPGEVYLFTMRGQRSLDLMLNGESLTGFIVPLPARPGREYEQWSDWGPRPPAPNPPWPDTKISYRFRVKRHVPAPSEPDPAVVAEQKFAALKPDAPLEQWLAFLEYDAPEGRQQAVLKVAESRPAELAKLIRSADSREREPALTAAEKLTQVTPEITAAVLAEGRDIAAGIRRFNEMKENEPRFLDVQIELRGRFSYWKRAWWNVHRRIGADGRPPLQEIHDLALVRSKGTSIDEILVHARVILEALNPQAK
jgi:hypothetical protein